MSRSMFGWSLPPGCTSQMIEDAFGASEPLDISRHLAAGGVRYWYGWWDEDGNLLAARKDTYDGENHQTLARHDWDDDVDAHTNMTRAAHHLAAHIRVIPLWAATIKEKK
jgi:hypothetical protein